MVAFLHRQSLNLPIATLAGVAAGLITALLFLVIPIGIIEDVAVESGIASVVAAAAPPLGETARFALLFLCGGMASLVTWYGVFLAIGQRALTVNTGGDLADRTPILRRADAHPDAPARRPLSALRDLGSPGFEPISFPPIDEADLKKLDEAAAVSSSIEDDPERTIPADLDQPLAAFDPDAILDSPTAWSPAPPSLAASPRKQVFDAGERFETFELTPIARRTPPPLAPVEIQPAPRASDPSESIHALLDRLERSVGKADRNTVASGDPKPLPIRHRADSIEDALVSLRRLASRA